jgi:hypothetical protein
VQWTKQSEQTVYSNRWFSVNLADVALPDGRHLDHFLIRLRPVAVATVVNEANEVLLLWRHRFITDSWGWELAAGVVEDDEGAYVGHPVDDFESDRREWVPLKLVPDMVARGEVPAANMAAALLLLHHLRLGQDAGR